MPHGWIRWAIAGIALGALVGACETTKSSGGGSQGGAKSSKTSTPAPPAASGSAAASGASSAPAFAFASSGDPKFDAWRTTFAGKAAAAGRKSSSILSVLDGLTPIPETVQVASFDNQAEFVKPIWDYAKSAVSPSRIANGRSKITASKDIFDGIEAGYATPREIVAAIWGMETSYGAILGDVDAPRALASQAAQGRRKDFNEGELMAIMQMIENGSATRDQFRKGSWAGAVGQTQFMPSTLLSQGRDFDADGKKDVWTDAGDALASAANYMTNSGWRKDEPWAVEVTLPDSFDYSQGDGRKLTVAAWKSVGLAPATTPQIANSDSLLAELFLPAGSYGPAFLLFDNFSVIKKYNNADSYALAVGLLADRLAGRPDLSRPWPANITMLTQDQAKQLQASLNKLGYSAGAVDGIIGRGTRSALQKFQKDKGLTADGFPTSDMLAKVVAAANT